MPARARVAEPHRVDSPPPYAAAPKRISPQVPQQTLVPWETEGPASAPPLRRASVRSKAEVSATLAARVPSPIERFTPAHTDYVSPLDVPYPAPHPKPDAMGCLRSLMLLSIGGAFGYFAGAVITAFTLSIAPVGRPPVSPMPVVVEPTMQTPVLPVNIQPIGDPGTLAAVEKPDSEGEDSDEDEIDVAHAQPAIGQSEPAVGQAKPAIAEPAMGQAEPVDVVAVPAHPKRRWQPVPPSPPPEVVGEATPSPPPERVAAATSAPTVEEVITDEEAVLDEDTEKKRKFRLFKRKKRDR